MERIPNRLFLFCFVFLLFPRISSVSAQELEPRAYSNVPVGLNFVLAGYSYSAGGVLFDPAIPIDNANIKTHGMIYAYARAIRVGGMSGKVDVILPYAWLSGTADFNENYPAGSDLSALFEAEYESAFDSNVFFRYETFDSTAYWPPQRFARYYLFSTPDEIQTHRFIVTATLKNGVLFSDTTSSICLR